MNRINDKGDYRFVLRSYFVSLFHFLWFKFKRFIQEVFCENGTLKFPKKTNVDLEKCFEGAHFTVVFNTEFSGIEAAFKYKPPLNTSHR